LPGYAIEDGGVCLAVWYYLVPFGIFYGHLVHFFPVLVFFYQEKSGNPGQGKNVPFQMLIFYRFSSSGSNQGAIDNRIEQAMVSVFGNIDVFNIEILNSTTCTYVFTIETLNSASRIVGFWGRGKCKKQHVCIHHRNPKFCKSNSGIFGKRKVQKAVSFCSTPIPACILRAG
jgi:hypothetical protein